MRLSHKKKISHNVLITQVIILYYILVLFPCPCPPLFFVSLSQSVCLCISPLSSNNISVNSLHRKIKGRVSSVINCAEHLLSVQPLWLEHQESHSQATKSLWAAVFSFNKHSVKQARPLLNWQSHWHEQELTVIQNLLFSFNLRDVRNGQNMVSEPKK